jgi:hypothetical protein
VLAAISEPSTVVDPRLRGQRLGAILVDAALNDVRTSGRPVVDGCWCVKQFIDKHPRTRNCSPPEPPAVGVGYGNEQVEKPLVAEISKVPPPAGFWPLT